MIRTYGGNEEVDDDCDVLVGYLCEVFLLYHVIKSRMWSVLWIALLIATLVFGIEGRSGWMALAALIAVLGHGQGFVLTKVARQQRR